MTHLPAEFFGVLMFLCAAIVLWGLLSPVEHLPLWSRTHDKLLHGVAFAILAVLANLWLRDSSVAAIWIALVAAGLIGEMAQHFSVHRQFCWRDALANALGASVGLCAFQVVLGCIDVHALQP